MDDAAAAAAPAPAGGSMEPSLSDVSVDFNIMDELFSGGCWLETSDYSELLRIGTPTSVSPLGPSGFSPLIGISNSSLNLNPPVFDNQDDAEMLVFSKDLPLDDQAESFRRKSVDVNAVGIPSHAVRSGGLDSLDPICEPGTSLWIRERGSVDSLGERLRHALDYIKETQRYGDVLVQIWVPVKRGDRHVLTTYGQPFSLNSNSQSLVNYRSVSTSYQFSTENDSHEALGLPGRVFLGRVPEWTPDVRYFSSQEYPRVAYAQRYEVCGTIALPIFESSSRSCLGVVEVLTTVQKINFSSDLENICNALQAVDLRSSEVTSVPRLKVSSNSYQAALPEIREVLRSVCKAHRLPLAQTWISCIHQSKKGRRHSEENYKECVSTVDAACYVNDPAVSDFHDACSDYHLFRGQGVVGKAFTTNQPCFSSDITCFSKTEYPLSHHAKFFHLHAAVAIRLRSIHTGVTDFVLEFFLPVDCRGSEEQKQMLGSLSTTIQQVCQSLRVVTISELADEARLQGREVIPSNVTEGNAISRGNQSGNGDDFVSSGYSKGTSMEGSSWVANFRKAQQKVTRMLPACMPSEFNMQGTGGFSVSTQWDCSDGSDVVLSSGNLFTEFKQHQQDSENMIDHKNFFHGEPGFSDAGKATEKRRTKTEKTVSLQVLRQYFAGSLKDAAESIGVCPTTLKRICRQHGISRWPSRKLKKVDRSLRKLQVVMDSVQGAKGAFKFGSLYENFSKASVPEKKPPGSSMFSALKQKDHLESSMLHQQQEARFTSHVSASKSLSSSSYSQSSSSSIACSSDTKQISHAPELKQETPAGDNQSGNRLKRTTSQVELHLPSENPPRSIARSQSHDILGEHISLRSLSPVHKKSFQMLKLKAIYGEEKIRFSLQPTWGFQDLKQEVAKRFNLNDPDLFNLKYLDDDAEWVLLTCDADLEECIDVYKSSHLQTIKISVHHIAQPASAISATPQGSHDLHCIYS